MAVLAFPITAAALWAPYCGPGPAPEAALASWNLDPPLLAAFAAGAALIALMSARGGRALHAGAAWVVLFALFVSPLCAMSAALFSARIANHLGLVAIAAPLLAVALGRIRAVERGGAFIAAAAGGHALIFWVWHAPAPYAFALSHDGGYWLMQLSLLISAVAFWRCASAVFDRPVAAFSLLTGFVAQMGLLGALIAFAPDPLYAPHFATAPLWGLSPLADQQLAGLLMWVPGMLPYLAVLMIALRRWFHKVGAETGA